MKLGNRVTFYDLDNNTSFTPDCTTRSDIQHLRASPDSKTMILVDKQGYSITVNLETYKVINHFRFKGPVKDIHFSPNSLFLAAALEKDIFIYEAPKLFSSIETLV